MLGGQDVVQNLLGLCLFEKLSAMWRNILNVWEVVRVDVRSYECSEPTKNRERKCYNSLHVKVGSHRLFALAAALIITRIIWGVRRCICLLLVSILSIAQRLSCFRKEKQGYRSPLKEMLHSFWKRNRLKSTWNEIGAF
jgi:hypothetical protein